MRQRRLGGGGRVRPAAIVTLAALAALTACGTPSTAQGPAPVALPPTAQGMPAAAAPSTSAPAPDPSSTETPPHPSTAAARYHWGAPLAQYSDEFDYTGAPDPAKWVVYGQGDDYRGTANCTPGNAVHGHPYGRRCASAVTVQDGYLQEAGYADGDTGGIASRWNSRYGRYEIRARIVTSGGGTGKPYHPNLLLWPESGAWPSGGEYDYAETNANSTFVNAWMHHPTLRGVVQDQYTYSPIDLAQWHNYAFQWTPTSLTGYIDGQRWFTDTARSAQAPGPMHQTIQLDDQHAGPLHPADLDVAWARFYSLPAGSH